MPPLIITMKMKTIKELQDRITKLLTQLDKLKSKDLFVPKEIELAGNNDIYGSIAVIKNEQALYSYNGFFGVGWDWKNENTGSNYKLTEVNKPEPDKLYFCTDYEKEDKYFEEDLKDIYYYKCYKTDKLYQFWSCDSMTNHERSEGWEHYYLVEKCE